jgi:hypothetical protein
MSISLILVVVLISFVCFKVFPKITLKNILKPLKSGTKKVKTTWNEID